jgi:TonB family protein
MNKTRNSTSLATWSSLLTHAAVLGLLLVAGHRTFKIRVIQSRGGEHTILYWQGAQNGSHGVKHRMAATKARKVDKPRQKPPQHVAILTSEPESENKVSANDFGGSQTGLQGVTPAYPVFSPSPHIEDRSLLPSASTNVVVDVDVSAQGDVLNEKLIQGLGSSLDQIVLDTVKTWKFHPASDNGSPVESVAELIFPFSPKWTG